MLQELYIRACADDRHCALTPQYRNSRKNIARDMYYYMLGTQRQVPAEWAPILEIVHVQREQAEYELYRSLQQRFAHLAMHDAAAQSILTPGQASPFARHPVPSDMDAEAPTLAGSLPVQTAHHDPLFEAIEAIDYRAEMERLFRRSGSNPRLQTILNTMNGDTATIPKPVRQVATHINGAAAEFRPDAYLIVERGQLDPFAPIVASTPIPFPPSS